MKYMYFLPYILFSQNVNKFLKQKGRFLACHQQNAILKTILLNTSQFTKKDIKKKFEITHVPIIHQYLEVKTKTGSYKVDPFYRILEKIN